MADKRKPNEPMTARELLGKVGKHSAMIIPLVGGVLIGQWWHIRPVIGVWEWVFQELEIILSGVIMVGCGLVLMKVLSSRWMDKVDPTNDNRHRLADKQDEGKALTLPEATALSGLERAKEIRGAAFLAIMTLAMLIRALQG